MNRAAIRIWERNRTAKLNALGLTSRGSPMKQRRRVFGPNRKAIYLREFRARRKAAGLTVRGTVPVKTLAILGEQVMQRYGIGHGAAVTVYGAVKRCEVLKAEAELRVARLLLAKEEVS